MAANIPAATTLNLAKNSKKYCNLKRKKTKINKLDKSDNNIDTNISTVHDREIDNFSPTNGVIVKNNELITKKTDLNNPNKKVEVPQNNELIINESVDQSQIKTVILSNKSQNDDCNPVTGTKEDAQTNTTANSFNQMFIKQQITEKGNDSSDRAALDSGQVGEVPPLSAASKPVISDVKAGSNGRILIIKSKTGKAIKLLTKNPIIVAKQDIIPNSMSKSDQKVTTPNSEPSSKFIKRVLTSDTISVTNPNPVQTTSTITTNFTKHVQISIASCPTSPNVIQNVSTITTNIVSSKNVPKEVLNSATSTQNVPTTTETVPNVKNTPQTVANTSKNTVDSDRTDIFPLKIPYAATKALQFTLTSKLQKVPEFHMLRIVNGSRRTAPLKKCFPYQRPPIPPVMQPEPAPAPKTVRTRTNSRSLIKVLVVDAGTQTESYPAQHCATQTDSVTASPARTVDDLPDIKDLVKYLLDNPEYSAGIDDCKKSDLLDMSETIMRAKMFPVPCKVSVKPNTFADNLKMQLFCDLKDCINFDLLGNLPIHKAIVENNISLVKRQCYALRLRNVSVNIENNERLIPLQMAVSNNCDTEIIRTLLEYGGDTNAKDHEGSTVVHLAVLHSTDYNLELVLKHSAALQYIINLKNDEGVTPLISAAISSKADMVEVLLNHGADPNLRDEKSGRTALFHAVEVNAKFVINSLLKFKADPKIRNFFGLTAVDAARDLDINDTNLDPPPPSNDTITLANRVVAQENSSRRGQKRPSVTNTEQGKKTRVSFNRNYRQVDKKHVGKGNYKKNGS